MDSYPKEGNTNKKKLFVKNSIVIRDSLENPEHYLVLNTFTGESYEVNNTGKIILDCCNGTLTKNEVAAKTAEMDESKISSNRILIKDIIQYCEILMKEGILHEA